MFQPQFAALVESGHKRQTVRPTPKRMPKVGEAISLRAWTGTPYRSRQRVLLESIITGVGEVKITEHYVEVDGSLVPFDAFAVADGFRDFTELRTWFQSTHGLPFEGVLIQWGNDKLTP